MTQQFEMMNLYTMQIFGPEKQALQLCEECGELIQAVSKMVRSKYSNETIKKMTEELADVMVVAKQFMQIFHVSDDDLRQIMEQKVFRQWDRMQAANVCRES